MAKSGFGILLSAMGINIDPVQVETDYADLKIRIATWGQIALDLRAQGVRIEAQNKLILEKLGHADRTENSGTETAPTDARTRAA